MTENGIVVKVMLAVTVILFIMCLIPETQVKPKVTREDVMNNLKKTITCYKIDKGVYPKYLNSLVTTIHPYLTEIPKDLLTGRTDWEVCDHSNKNIWYRTVTDVYEPHLPLWNPGPESGIYDIRPCSKE